MNGNPLDFAASECVAHRKELEALRDRRAGQLGELAFLGNTLLVALNDLDEEEGDGLAATSSSGKYLAVSQVLAAQMEGILASSSKDSKVSAMASLSNPVSASTASATLQTYLSPTGPLASHSTAHTTLLTPHLRPSTLTLLWPRILLFPPLFLFTARYAYTNRASISESVREAGETVRGFWQQWVLEPVGDILRTVRAGGEGEEGGRVISKDGLRSDMDVRLSLLFHPSSRIPRTNILASTSP